MHDADTTPSRRRNDLGIESRILEVVTANSPRGTNMTEIAARGGYRRNQLWLAVRRLERAGRIFRFNLGDAEEREAKSAAAEAQFMVLHEHRHCAYVEQAMTMDESVEALYLAMGTTPPKTIQRSPPFIPLRDDQMPKRNRYAEEIAEYAGSALCNLRGVGTEIA